MVREAVSAAIDPNTHFRAPVVWLLCAAFAIASFMATSAWKGADVYYQFDKSLDTAVSRIAQTADRVSDNRQALENIRSEVAQQRLYIDSQISRLQQTDNDRNVAIGRIDERLKLLDNQLSRQNDLLERLLADRSMGKIQIKPGR